MSSCPRCGRAVPEGFLPRFGGACPDCVLAFAVQPAVPEIPGLTLGPLLGRGGMSEVYHGRQDLLHRDVAVKFMLEDLADDASLQERFSLEAAMLAKMNHPNIVTVHEFGVRDGTAYLVMEKIEGRPLRDHLDHRFDSRQAAEMGAQIADALAYAHSAGVIHRDLKPDNILVEPSGRLRLVDFGLAKLATVPHLTQSGARIGTPAYMAPEQIETPRDIDARADLYALGVVLYELLTGELPVGRFEPLGRDVDRRLAAIVMKLLAKDPGDRFSTAVEVRDRLRAWRPRKRWPVVAAILVIAVGAAAYAMSTQGPRNSATPPAARWVELGDSGGRIIPGVLPALVLDREDRPIVATKFSSSEGLKLRMSRWTGNAWVPAADELGLGAGAEVSRAALAVDLEGLPMVAWYELEGGRGRGRVRFRRWTGMEWRPPEEVGSVDSYGAHPVLAADPSGRPVMAWFEGDPGGPRALAVKRWDGTAWVAVGGRIAETRTVTGPPSLALDSKGRPFLAWPDNEAIRVSGWDGAAWRDYGGVTGTQPALQVDGEGRPVLAWTDLSTGGSHVFLKRWTGERWEELGGSATAPGITRLSGSKSPSLAIDVHGRPIVAWEEDLPSPKVLLNRWNGRTWEELGGSGRIEGLSRGSSSATHPALVLTQAGNPVLVWQGADGGQWVACGRAWRP